MGISQTKEKSGGGGSPGEKVVEGLKERVRHLQGEMKEIICMRESESEAYERELMVFAFKQAEWKRERKRMKEETKKLKNLLEEKQQQNPHELIVTSDQIKEEQIRRDQTLEKWKQLYFAIKAELDDLIQTTRQEERTWWRMEEEDVMLELKQEVAAKEERIEFLQKKLASMEDQELKREREIDILRQSLRIMSHKKRAAAMIEKTDHSKNFNSQ